MAASKSHGESDTKKEQGPALTGATTGTSATGTGTSTTGSGFELPADLVAQLAKIAELRQVLGSSTSSLILRSLIGGAQIAGAFNVNLNVYFAALQQRSLPRASFRFSSSV